MRQRERELTGHSAFNGCDYASDFYYQHHVIDGRITLVRGQRRANVQPEQTLGSRRVFIPPARCAHVVNGAYNAACGYCAWLARPDRLPVKRDNWRLLAADLDLVCGEIDPATEDEQTPLSIAA